MALDLTKPVSNNVLVKALYKIFAGERTGVCNGMAEAVLSDTADLAHPGYFQVRGNAGNVKFDPVEGASGQTMAFEAKECSLFRVKRIYSNGTTATGIVIYY